jgi:4-hydroxy-2-oxoheptanedioate aldolase
VECGGEPPHTTGALDPALDLCDDRARFLRELTKGERSMPFTQNKLKALLESGQVAYGTCMCAFSPNLVELAGYCGFDFCRIDNEHAWRQDSAIEHMIRAAIIGGLVPLARIDKDDPYLVRKAFEIGAGGIIIPDIRSADEVERVVEAAKFPPHGQRGFSSLCFSGQYGTAPAGDWISWSNAEQMVGVMIETPEAVAQIEAIMAVEGLDFVLFGPSDFSINSGLPAPNKNHPVVQDAIRRTVAAANAHDKYVMLGISAPWAEEAAKYLEMGIKMIEVGHDYSVLGWAWQTALKAAKSA